MIKYTPQHFLGYSLLIYMLLFIVGPYSYEIRSGWALLYLLIAYFLWFIGIKISAMTRGRIRTVEKEMTFSDFSEYVLLFIECVTLLLSLLYLLYYVIKVFGAGKFGDTRNLTSQFPTVLRLIPYESYITVGIYIIISYSSEVKVKLLGILSKVCVFLPSILFLISGGRWTLFVVLLLFGGVECSRGKKFSLSKKMKWVICGVIAALLFFCFILFAIRGASSTYVTYMPYYGNVETKDIWEIIGSSPFGKPIYSIFFYFTHSIPYYAEVFEQIAPEHLYYGAYMCRIIGFLSSSFPQYKTIVQEIPCIVGSYSTIVTGYIRDWGFVGTMPAIFVTGWLMGSIDKLKNMRNLARVMQPYMLVVCLLSPLYYGWHAGGMDFMMVLTLALYGMLKVTNRIYIKKER